MTKGNEPINSIPDLNNHHSEWYGLTKREYFAAMAMQGILANPNTSHQIESQYGKIDANDANKILAYTATKLSDALIKALNEIKP